MLKRRKTTTWWKRELSLNTQKEVIQKIHEIIDTTEMYTPLDHGLFFLLQVLKHHRYYESKVGVGIKHLEIRWNQNDCGKLTKGLWIIRTDSTEIDISWRQALLPNGEPSLKEMVSSAARYETRAQIDLFYRNESRSVCELCHKHISQYDEIHVDHIQVFEQLFSNFLDTVHMTYSDIKIHHLGLDNEFVDRHIALLWSQYHMKYATLRIVHSKCNLKRPRFLSN